MMIQSVQSSFWPQDPADSNGHPWNDLQVAGGDVPRHEAATDEIEDFCVAWANMPFTQKWSVKCLKSRKRETSETLLSLNISEACYEMINYPTPIPPTEQLSIMEPKPMTKCHQPAAWLIDSYKQTWDRFDQASQRGSSSSRRSSGGLSLPDHTVSWCADPDVAETHHVVLTCEVKTGAPGGKSIWDQLTSGTAQDLAYGIAGYRLCGARQSILIVGNTFRRSFIEPGDKATGEPTKLHVEIKPEFARHGQLLHLGDFSAMPGSFWTLNAMPNTLHHSDQHTKSSAGRGTELFGFFQYVLTATVRAKTLLVVGSCPGCPDDNAIATDYKLTAEEFDGMHGHTVDIAVTLDTYVKICQPSETSRRRLSASSKSESGSNKKTKLKGKKKHPQAQAKMMSRRRHPYDSDPDTEPKAGPSTSKSGAKSGTGNNGGATASKKKQGQTNTKTTGRERESNDLGVSSAQLGGEHLARLPSTDQRQHTAVPEGMHPSDSNIDGALVLRIRSEVMGAGEAPASALVGLADEPQRKSLDAWLGSEAVLAGQSQGSEANDNVGEGSLTDTIAESFAGSSASESDEESEGLGESASASDTSEAQVTLEDVFDLLKDSGMVLVACSSEAMDRHMNQWEHQVLADCYASCSSVES